MLDLVDLVDGQSETHTGLWVFRSSRPRRKVRRTIIGWKTAHDDDRSTTEGARGPWERAARCTRSGSARLQPHVSPAVLERTSASAMIAIGIRARLLVSEAPAVCSARRRFRRDMIGR